MAPLLALPSLACHRTWPFSPPLAPSAPARRRQPQGTVLSAAPAEKERAVGRQENAARFEEAEFNSMLEKLRAWKERNYDCIVPRKVGPQRPPMRVAGRHTGR